jgi:uncharacterized membrane protein
MTIHQTRQRGAAPQRRSTGGASQTLRRGAQGIGRALAGGDGELLANGLAWFSIGLGVAEIAAPGSVAKLIGVRDDEDNRAVLRTCGLRELASGIAILSQPQPTSALWGRVAGDMMDLFLLGTAASSPSAERERLALAGAAVAGVTLLDVVGAVQHSRREGLMNGQASGQGSEGMRRMVSGRREPRRLAAETQREQLERRGIHVKMTTTVNRPVAEVYGFWRDFQNLPRFMHHLESVQVLDARRSRWTAKAPMGATVEWEAEIVDERENQLISWRSVAGATVDNAGSVRFMPAPGDRGTEVQVELVYRPPLGAVGAIIAKLFGEEPQEQVKHDLRMFKAVMETGEVVHSDASIHRGAHPAHPAEKVHGSETNYARGGAR